MLVVIKDPMAFFARVWYPDRTPTSIITVNLNPSPLQFQLDFIVHSLPQNAVKLLYAVEQLRSSLEVAALQSLMR